MKQLFKVDLKDYDEGLPHFVRPSVRGIMIKDGRLAVVYSKKFDYYKYAGGGIEAGEDHKAALIREISEETGLTVIPESIREFGSFLRIQKSRYAENTVFEQENFYYLCETEDEAASQHLDEYESDEGFTLEYAKPEHIIEVNRTHDHHGYDEMLIEREAMMTEYIMKNGYI